MTHSTHTMHENSLEAFQGINVTAKELEVLKVFKRKPKIEWGDHSLTDREVAALLEWDITSVRPRISGLIDKKYLFEVMKVREKGSRRNVRMCGITYAGRKYLAEIGMAYLEEKGHT